MEKKPIAPSQQVTTPGVAIMGPTDSGKSAIFASLPKAEQPPGLYHCGFLHTASRWLCLYDFSPFHHSTLYTPSVRSELCEICMLTVPEIGLSEESFALLAGEIVAYGECFQALIVAVTMMDGCAPAWSQERFEAVRQIVAKKLMSRLSQGKFRSIYWVPANARTGENVSVRSPNAPWYGGQTVAEILDTVPIFLAEKNLPALRFVMESQCYSELNSFIVFGKLLSGSLATGAPVQLGAHTVCEVSQILAPDLSPVESVQCGTYAFVTLPVPPAAIEACGGVITAPGQSQCVAFRTVIAEVHVAQTLVHKPIIVPGYECSMVIHNYAVKCTFWKFVTAKRYAKAGDTFECRLAMEKTVLAEKYETMKALGWMYLMDEGTIIGYGKILKYKPANE